MTSEQKIAFARSILKIADGVLAGDLDTSAVIGRMEGGIKWLKAIGSESSSAPPTNSKKLGPSLSEVREIFDYWQRVTSRRTAVLDDKRKGIIRNALRNFSADQLKHIIAWAAQDPNHQGANKNNKRYDWIEPMFRNVSRIEDLLERSQWGATIALSSEDGIERSSRREELEEESKAALKSHQIDEYNRLQAEIAELGNE